MKKKISPSEARTHDTYQILPQALPSPSFRPPPTPLRHAPLSINVQKICSLIIAALLLHTVQLYTWKNHKSERTDAASASYYSYPRDSNPRAAYKKSKKNFLKIFEIFFEFFIQQLFSADAKM